MEEAIGAVCRLGQQTALERQDVSCTFLADHGPTSMKTIIIIIIINVIRTNLFHQNRDVARKAHLMLV